MTTRRFTCLATIPPILIFLCLLIAGFYGAGEPAELRCGVASLYGAPGDCGWRVKTLTFHHVIGRARGLTIPQVIDALNYATDQYTRNSGVRFRWIDFPSDRNPANVMFLLDDLPGPTVGRAEIGCAFEATRTARVWLDSGQTWTPDLARKVLTHELGHALGLVHRNDPTSIMYPSVGVAGLSPADIADVRALYGMPTR